MKFGYYIYIFIYSERVMGVHEIFGYLCHNVN